MFFQSGCQASHADIGAASHIPPEPPAMPLPNDGVLNNSPNVNPGHPPSQPPAMLDNLGGAADHLHPWLVFTYLLLMNAYIELDQPLEDSKGFLTLVSPCTSLS